MKICIFYSWQSDLPNNKNRGLINTCIKKATNEVLKNSRNITEFEIDMDSRNESGTPDLVHSIIEKIEACDIFVADISIINSNCDCRLAPNPNVLFELGYAAKTLGWHRTLCLFNKEYARIEDLPFDIRFRKPIVYDTSKSVSDARSYLTNELTLSIQSIIDTEHLFQH